MIWLPAIKQIKLVARQSWRAVHNSRFNGAALRAMRLKHGVGRPPKKEQP
jgi:hypothetical protein